MMCPNEQDDAADGELVETRPADPVRAAFAAAIAAVIDAMPGDSFARETVIKEIMRAHERTRVAIVRRFVN